MRAALRSEPKAVDEIVGRLQRVPRLLAALNARVGRPLRPGELEDVAQDVALVVLRKLGRFEGRSALESWVYRICALELLTYLRRRRRQPAAYPTHVLTEAAAPPAAESRNLLDREHVLVALERMPARIAEVVRLKHFEALTFEQIAVRLDISANTVKTRYYRGLARLETLLRTLQGGNG